MTLIHKFKKNPFTFFILISLLLHILFLLIFGKGMDHLRDIKQPQTPVWVTFKQLEKEKLPQRIADIPEPEEEEIPETPSAQALYSQKVKEETVRPGMGPPEGTPSTPERQEKTSAEKTKDSSKELSPSELYAMRTPKKEPGAGLPQPTWGFGGTGSMDDYFPDFKVGDKTYINTLGNPDIAYFVELKRKFKLTFNPVPALRSHINEISRGKIDVVIGVSVDRSGQLASLIVIRPSGLQNYDLEGIRTVKSSAPFSAPPPHLLEEDGMLHMAWTFVVYL